MLARRLIACLDVSHGQVVKGVNFGDLKEAGDPVALAKRYNDESIDELVMLDISATPRDGRFIDTITAIAASSSFRSPQAAASDRSRMHAWSSKPAQTKSP
jgi:cyclase